MPEHQRSGARTLNMRDLGAILCDQNLQPPIRSLCLWNANPVVSLPDQSLVIKGLLREDLFTVVHDLFVTETARFADYLLPATSQLEHLDLMPAWGHHYLALNRPAIPPQGEAVANTEFFRRLARALDLQPEWLYHSDEQLVRTALQSSHPWLEGITFESLWQDGFARLRSPADWRPYAQGFPTATGRAQLRSAWLEEQGLDSLPTPGVIAEGEPGQLQLISGKSLYHLNGTYSYSSHHNRRSGPLTIDVHPEDADERGLVSGDRVVVGNPAGEIEAICRVTDAVVRGVVWMPFGFGKDVQQQQHSVNLLTPVAPTDWGGGSGFYDAFVTVRRAAV